jgi:hypothetical protein
MDQTPSRNPFPKPNFSTPLSLTRTPAIPPGSTSKKRLSASEKLAHVLEALEAVHWTVPGFLDELFSQQSSDGQAKRTRVVTSMLNGSSKPYVASILEKMFDIASTKTNFLKNDTTANPGRNMFNPERPPQEIRHAYPAMTTWAVRLVSELVNNEAKQMVNHKTGLHYRAQAKEGGKHEQNQITWEAVQSFSFEKLEALAKANAPVMSFLMNSYTHSQFSSLDPGDSVVMRTYRPENLVSSLQLF